MASKDAHEPPHPPQADTQSLVPIYSPVEVARGVQAYRRGDRILYTIRGEPDQVMELIGALKGRGVGEVVALVSHQTDDEQGEGGSQ